MTNGLAPQDNWSKQKNTATMHLLIKSHKMVSMQSSIIQLKSKKKLKKLADGPVKIRWQSYTFSSDLWPSSSSPHIWSGELPDTYLNIDQPRNKWITSDNKLTKWNKHKLKLSDKVLEIKLKELVSQPIQLSRKKANKMLMKESMN